MEHQNHTDNVPNLPGLSPKANNLWKIAVTLLLVAGSIIGYFQNNHWPLISKRDPGKRPPLKAPETVVLTVSKNVKGASAIIISDCVDASKGVNKYIWLTNPQDPLSLTVRVKIEAEQARTSDIGNNVCLQVSRDVGKGIHLSRDNVISLAELRTELESGMKHANVQQQLPNTIMVSEISK